MNSLYTGNIWVMELQSGNDTRCHNMFRMNKDVFFKLCDDLKNTYKVKASRRISVAEKVAMFLYTLGGGEASVQE